MKNVLSILFLTVGSQFLNAHPKVEHHSHDSFIGQWAWLIIPFLITLFYLGWSVYKNTSKKKI